MQDDPLWIDATALMQAGTAALRSFVAKLSADPEQVANVGDFVGRLSKLLSITDLDLHIEEFAGADETLDLPVGWRRRLPDDRRK